MAGLGFKDFQVGEVLTSSDVDGYLMQQTVMRFADSAARGSALGTAPGTAVPLASGMVAYLDDLDVVEVYTGSTWARVTPSGIGSNVVQGIKTDTLVASLAAGAFTTVTDLTATITPTRATSKVLVMGSVTVSGGTAAGSGGIGIILERDGTPVGVGATVGSRTSVTAAGLQVVTHALDNISFVYLDSPATTSAVVYTVEVGNGSSGTQTIRVNRNGNDGSASYEFRSASTLVAIEVAA